MSATLKPASTHFNISPEAFRILARDYFKAYLDFQAPRRFSPIPFFLCCRAMELALKAEHLERKSQKEVKLLYYHDVLKAYADLAADQKTLTHEEETLLTAANEIYVAKDFEYFNLFDAVSAYKRFPDLDKLGALAKKITKYDG
jgi:hypothetical protein